MIMVDRRAYVAIGGECQPNDVAMRCDGIVEHRVLQLCGVDAFCRFKTQRHMAQVGAAGKGQEKATAETDEDLGY